MVHRKKVVPSKGVAYERMGILFRQAKLRMSTDPAISSGYIRLIERIGKRMDLPVPREIKRFYCKTCGIPYGSESKVRIKRGLCIVTCANCGDLRRIPYRE